MSMYGMHSSQALVFFASACVLILATQWRHFHPFVALVVIAPAFGAIAGYTMAQLGSNFGSGFSEKIYSPGLLIVAGAVIGGLAESMGASDRLMATIERWRWPGSNWIAGFLGLIAGIAASPASAFALLTPLMRPIGGASVRSRQAASIAAALAISASHGLALFAPVPIAAAAILGADWGKVALFGLPLAVLVAAFGAAFARWPSGFKAAEGQPAAEPQRGAAGQSGGSSIALLLATAIPLLMLIEQSLGDIPSEPLGGGPARELVLGIGRPLMLLLVSVGIMVIGQPRRGLGLLADSAWMQRVLGNVASVLLIVCAAGGLQRLCQLTGMAEMLGERTLSWHLGAFGVLIPFLAAAAIKTLQGSSSVAAIATAGMVEPVLTAIGLADTNGKALAALAIGAGAMTVSHVNDEYFWLVTQSIGFRPLRGLAAVSLGMLLQGMIAAAALLALSVLVPRG
jgi:gluconate:H+ symporter, GntP family